MTTLYTPDELREVLGYNESVSTLNGETFEDLFDRLRGGERDLELDVLTLQELFELVREDVWVEASNPAFQRC
jgi:hypothetical protein